MKNLFNKKLAAVLFVFVGLISGNSFAADLVVQESGPTGTYASIGAAVAASLDGDRIIINNLVSGLPWMEDITVDKSLTFLSAVDNQRFIVQGNYTVEHAPGREVTFVGMDNYGGNISSVANGGTARTKVNVMWCTLVSGDISFNHDYFDLNVSSSVIEGDIVLRYGKVIGNQFNGGSSILILTDALAGVDSVHVVGNDDLRRIYCGSTSHYIYVSNNNIRNEFTGGSLDQSAGIAVFDLKVGAGTNVIRNNSISVRHTGIYIGSAVDGNLLVYNNIIHDMSVADYGIRLESSMVALVVSYNFLDDSFDFFELSNTIPIGTNTISGSVGLTSAGVSTWSGTIDGGNPGVSDYDLNLSRNDAGAYGGSYSLDNFFPIDGASSKVFYLEMPTQILIGGSNPVKGYSFDR